MESLGSFSPILPFDQIPLKNETNNLSLEELDQHLRLENDIINFKIIDKAKEIIQDKIKAQPSKLKNKYNFNILYAGKSYLLTVKIGLDEKGILVKKYETYSFKEAKENFSGAPQTEKEFNKDLKKLSTLACGQSEVIDIPNSPLFVVDWIKKGNFYFHLSDEAKKGLRGERTADHNISLEILEKSLVKIKKLKKIRKLNPTKEKGLDFYFKINLGEENYKILNVVLGFSPNNNKFNKERHFVVKTAYTMTSLSVKIRLDMRSDIQFESWLNGLAQISALN